MRATGTMHPTDTVFVPPDSVQCLLLVAGTAQALDWPTTAAGAAANAATAGAHIARFTGCTSGGSTASIAFNVNLLSTGVIAMTSGTSVNSTAGVSHPIPGTRTYQIPGTSTGWSAIANTGGYVYAELWHI